MKPHRYAGAAFLILMIVAVLPAAQGQTTYYISTPGTVTCTYSASSSEQNDFNDGNSASISVIGPTGTQVAYINFGFYANMGSGTTVYGGTAYSANANTNGAVSTTTSTGNITFQAQGISLTTGTGSANSYTSGTANGNGPMSGTIVGASTESDWYNPTLSNGPGGNDVDDTYNNNASCSGTFTFYAPTVGYYTFYGTSNSGNNGNGSLGPDSDWGNGGAQGGNIYYTSYNVQATIGTTVTLSTGSPPSGGITATQSTSGAGGVTLNWTITPPADGNGSSTVLAAVSAPPVTPTPTPTPTPTSGSSGSSGTDSGSSSSDGGDGGGSSGGMTQ